MWVSAVASATLTVVARAITIAYCSECGRRVMTVPGRVSIEVRPAAGAGSGRGRVVSCRKCFASLEVIEHAGP